MIELILHIFFDIIFQGATKFIEKFGLIILNLITRNNYAPEEIKEKYKDSFLPYLIGSMFTIGLVLLILVLIF